MVLFIDNYDSFTYNLVQLAGGLCQDIRVIRTDEMAAEEIAALHPDHIILSPGPGYPKDAGVCEELIRLLSGCVPILGVCLGHQAICECFGARIRPAGQLMHGKQSTIRIDTRDPLFHGLPERITAARYHALAADEKTLSRELTVTARDGAGEIMAVRHAVHPLFGLQFHPESIMTPDGAAILANFLHMHRPNRIKPALDPIYRL